MSSAFARPKSSVLAAVVTSDPQWSALPAALPDSLVKLLQRCLARDPRVRLRDIGEARILLERLLQDPVSPVVARSVARPSTLSILLVLLFAAAAAAGGYLFGRRAPGSSPRLLQTTFQQIPDQPGLERQPTISPDGKTVVFVSEARGNSDLYLLRVGGRNALLLTEDSEEADYAPAFSPDGNRIAFRSERNGGGIFVMEATGESVRRVADFGFDPRWSPDLRGAEAARHLYGPVD